MLALDSDAKRRKKATDMDGSLNQSLIGLTVTALTAHRVALDRTLATYAWNLRA